MRCNAVRDVVISGIGIVTSLGEGVEPHIQILNTAPQPVLDTQRFAPFPIHPAPVLNLDTQIPKKGDQRQMEPWQRLGVYAAGLALDDAGLKGNTEALSKMHMVVAAGGGERDPQADETILSGMTATDSGAYLNERLMNDLRPTLFLAQLSNLLAGNISLVHGVTGSSRTFMGEEMAGMDAIRTLHARIANGQGDIGLVGGAYSAERPDMLLLLAFASTHLKDEFAPVWSRTQGGMVTGSMSVFLVLEEAAHAAARGAKVWAKLSKAVTDRCAREAGDFHKNLEALYGDLVCTAAQPFVVSCASGVAPITNEEEQFWSGKNAVVRAIGSITGHGLEAQAPLACALAALALNQNKFFPAFEPKEKSGADQPEQIIVSCCGHWRGEGLALLERASA